MNDVVANQAVSNYRAAIRSAFRGLWSGALSFDQFLDSMFAAIDFGFRQIWFAGARECGVQPSELSPAEKQRLAQFQFDERQFVFRVGEFIGANSRENGGKLGAVFRRVTLWTNRAEEVKNTAKVMACGDQKLEWVVDRSKDNCISALKLDGKVKRASFWTRVHVRPQSTKLECVRDAGGIPVCGCKFGRTDKPLSMGPLPSLP